MEASGIKALLLNIWFNFWPTLLLLALWIWHVYEKKKKEREEE